MDSRTDETQHAYKSPFGAQPRSAGSASAPTSIPSSLPSFYAPIKPVHSSHPAPKVISASSASAKYKSNGSFSSSSSSTVKPLPGPLARVHSNDDKQGAPPDQGPQQRQSEAGRKDPVRDPRNLGSIAAHVRRFAQDPHKYGLRVVHAPASLLRAGERAEEGDADWALSDDDDGGGDEEEEEDRHGARGSAADDPERDELQLRDAAAPTTTSEDAEMEKEVKHARRWREKLLAVIDVDYTLLDSRFLIGRNNASGGGAMAGTAKVGSAAVRAKDGGKGKEKHRAKGKGKDTAAPSGAASATADGTETEKRKLQEKDENVPLSSSAHGSSSNKLSHGVDGQQEEAVKDERMIDPQLSAVQEDKKATAEQDGADHADVDMLNLDDATSATVGADADQTQARDGDDQHAITVNFSTGSEQMHKSAGAIASAASSSSSSSTATVAMTVKTATIAEMNADAAPSVPKASKRNAAPANDEGAPPPLATYEEALRPGMHDVSRRLRISIT